MTAVETRAGAVAFSDIVGFTAFTEAAGDATALRVVDELDAIVDECIDGDARVVKNLGDGHLLWFPDATSAVTSGLRIQDLVRVRRLGDEDPLWLRMGIHWGAPTWRGADLFGHDVNVAARVTDAAGAGEVVVTRQTKQAMVVPAGRPVDFVEIGPTTMKGLKDPIWLYRVQPAEVGSLPTPGA